MGVIKNAEQLKRHKGKIFQHFKGNQYLLIDVAEHIETGEKFAICKALYGKCEVYAIPIKVFLGQVNRNIYPNVKQRNIFNLIFVRSAKKSLNNTKG